MYRIRWARRAMDELADHWTQAEPAVRHDITAAVPRLEERLRLDAAHEGESRASGLRVMFEPPLTVTFRVHAGAQIASVLHVRLFRRRA